MTHDQENDRNAAWLRKLLDGLDASNSSAEELAGRLYVFAHGGRKTIAHFVNPNGVLMTEKIPGDSDTPITRDQARDSANRLINSFFNKEPGARAGIPARPGYDDDLVIMQYLREQAVALEAKDAKIAKLEAILKPFADAVYNDLFLLR